MAGEMSSILRELEKVQDQLSSLTNDAHDEKYALMTRQDELRTRAARMAEDVDAECSTKDLLIRLAALRRRRDLLNRQHHSTGPGGLGPGQRGGVSQVEEGIGRIRALLADRGICVH